MAQRVRLMRSPLTGRVYAVTRYREDASGLITATTKHDVTADFEALVDSDPAAEDALSRDYQEDTDD